jgi:hypothetical protein
MSPFGLWINTAILPGRGMNQDAAGKSWAWNRETRDLTDINSGEASLLGNAENGDSPLAQGKTPFFPDHSSLEEVIS